jgi:hypothetical protein
MWFWHVKETIEVVSGFPAPQFGWRNFVSVRIRVGSKFRHFLCFGLINLLETKRFLNTI